MTEEQLFRIVRGEEDSIILSARAISYRVLTEVVYAEYSVNTGIKGMFESCLMKMLSGSDRDVYLAVIAAPDLNMVDNVQGVYFPTIMLALLGIWFSIQFSNVILKNDNVSRIFKYLGKNTIVILGFSQPIWLTTFFLMKKTPIPMYISVPLMLVILGGYFIVYSDI